MRHAPKRAVQEPAQEPAPPEVTRRRKRARIGSNFASQAKLEEAKRAREVDEFVSLLPPSVESALLGGELAELQLPCPEERLVVLKAAVAHKAGPDGGTLRAACAAWIAYRAYALERDVPDLGLPGSRGFVAAFIRAELEKAARGRGTQGGTTVGNARRVGLLWLEQKLGFPLDVNNVVVEAAGNSGQIRAHRRADPAKRQKRKAGSLPIAVYCQFETLARGVVATPLRFFARSMCAFSLAMSVRAVDALRTVEDADDVSPDTVMSGWAYFSKDGEPMKTYAQARGFTGDYEWWPAHRDAVRAAGRAFPKWELPYGAKGSLARATGPPMPFVLPKAHLVASIEACLKAPPLSLSDAAFKSLCLTAHSEHGSPSDMLQTLGAHSPFGAFLREEVREIGHWLRLGGLEEQLEGGTAGAQARHRGAGAGRQATGAFANNAAECAAAYCQGQGREGRRMAQVRVRRRWVDAVRAALRASGKTWLELPEGRADYDCLRSEEAEE